MIKTLPNGAHKGTEKTMGIQLNEPLPDDLRSCTVVSWDEQTATIGELVDGQATLLVFVRHFGCIGCSENIGLLQPRLKELEGLDTRIIIIGCGEPAYNVCNA